MAERSDIQPTNEIAATTPTAETSTPAVPEITVAPTLVPSEAPQVEIARQEGTESTAPDIKLPPVAQIAPPTRSRFGRVLEKRGPGPRPIPQPNPAPIKPAPIKPAQPKSRFPLLAASLALAAAIGAAAGSVGIPAAVQLAFAPSPTVTPAQETAAEIAAIRGLAAQLASDLSAFRNTVELSSRATTSQFGKLAERLDRADRAQADGKLAKISEAVERLERRAAGPDHGDVTGSIAKPQPQPQAQPPAEKAEAKPKPTIIEEYVLRRVFDGVALVEGRRGIVEVEPGANLPGAGRVEEIRRQDGRWVVVTNKGLIIPGR